MEKVELPRELKGITIPKHIAVIMDGNGRWARQQGLLRINGHDRGASAVREITRSCAKLGVSRLTLYAFSAENWERPRREINHLMKLLKDYLVKERDELMENNIKLVTIGRTGELPQDVREVLSETMNLVSGNTGMVLNLALNYGGRQEIIDAVKRIINDVKLGRMNPENITIDKFEQYMYDPSMDPPDLLIRTGGEMRISNFLLWHVSYTEIVVIPILWPDFTKSDLYEAIREYSNRERKFGRIEDL